MTSSEPDDAGTEQAFSAFKEMHGLGEEWSVRFTADEFRAREMAQEYRASGHEVRVLPLTPEGEELDPDSFDQFDGADHDPLQHVMDPSCTACLGGTHVVLTKEEPAPGPDEGLVYE